MTLDDLLGVFRRWLYLPDPSPLYAALGAIAANRLPGDPVWLLLVGPPSCGKTELLNATLGLSDTWPVSTLTQAGLLSGSISRSPRAHGGLLHEMGEFGVLVFKDFTSVIDESHDTRKTLLAALREIYDGRWTRHLGTGGGHTLEWEGKAGVLAGVTDSIDRHLNVMGTMGPRFLLCRMPDADNQQLIATADRSIGHETEMRNELAHTVEKFFAEAVEPDEWAVASGREWPELTHLAEYSARARSPIERETYVSREIELVPRPEVPIRLYCALSQFTRGLKALGLDEHEARRLTTKVAVDGIPALRRQVLEHLAEDPNLTPATRNVADAIGYDTKCHASHPRPRSTRTGRPRIRPKSGTPMAPQRGGETSRRAPPVGRTGAQIGMIWRGRPQ